MPTRRMHYPNRPAPWLASIAALGSFIAGSYVANAAPPNDDCTNAQPISLGYTFGTNLDATSDGPDHPTCVAYYQTGNDVWYQFTADATGVYQFDTLSTDPNQPGTLQDTVLSVYSECYYPELACNDNFDIQLYSKVYLSLAAGETVRIRIANDAFNPDPYGSFTLNAAFLGTPTGNDACETATELTPGVAVYDDNTAALISPFYNYCWCAYGYDSPQDRFYSLTAPSEGIYQFIITPTDGVADLTALFLASSCDPNYVAIVDCASDRGQGDPEERTLYMIAGETIRIRVSSYNNYVGSYSVLANFMGLAPGDDSCATASVLSHDEPLNGDNTGAYPSALTAGCALPDTDGRNDKFHQFTAPVAGTYAFIVTPNGDFTLDPIVSVFGSCDPGSELACSDANFQGAPEVVQANLYAGQTVYIRISGKNALQGQYTLEDRLVVTPSNDECVDALPLSLGSTFGSSLGATIDGISGSCAEFETPSFVWYEFSAGADGIYQFDLQNSPSLYHTRLIAYDYCGSSDIACSDGTDNTYFYSRIRLHLAPSQSIRLAVGGTRQTQGEFTLNATYQGPSPSNDDCNNALILSESTVTNGTNVNALESLSRLNACAPSDNNHDVFYFFTPSNTGPYEVILTAVSPKVDYVLRAAPGCDFQNEYPCSNFGGQGDVDRMGLELLAGVPIVLRVSSTYNDEGAFTIEVRPGVRPPNDDCSGAIVVLGDGMPISGDALLALDDPATSCDFDPYGDPGLESHDGLWYVFNPGVDSGNLDIRETSKLYTALTVFTGSCGSLTPVSCSDYELASLRVDPNTSYYIEVCMYDQSEVAGIPYETIFHFVADTGACCTGSTCSILSHSACNSAGGSFIGAGTPCLPPANMPTTFSGANNLPLAFPPFGTATSSLNVASAFTVSTGSVSVTIDHSVITNVDIELTNNSVSFPLTVHTYSYFFFYPLQGTYVFSDTASQSLLDAAIEASNNGVPPGTPIPSGTYRAADSNGRPVSITDALAGQPSNGTWSIKIGEGYSVGGTVSNWSLSLDKVGPSPCAPPPCPGDFNGDRSVTVSDIFAFLNAWFSQFNVCSGTCSADINSNGTVEVADIFAFLNQWFSHFGVPCP